MRRPPVQLIVAIVGLLAAVLALGACRQSKVHVAFRPEVGARYRYEVKVSKVTTIRLGTEPEQRSTEETALQVENTVLAAGNGEVRMHVVLRRANSPDRTFVVRFDRAAQLAGVEAVEGLPASVLGPSTFPEFLPAAAAAPPDRPLSPGESWKIDARPSLPGAPTARLEGTGRLVSVKESGKRKVASIRSETRLPLTSAIDLRGGTATLDGVETTETNSSRSVVDGAVEKADSVSIGDYRVTVSAPFGERGPSVPGTMTIEVRSQTTRLP